MRERQLEYGDSLFLLQPNVKEGAGTLRDYHAAYWVARGTQPSVRDVDDLLAFRPAHRTGDGRVSRRPRFHLADAQRTASAAKRANDQMSFERQEEVLRVGYGSWQSR